MKTKQSFEPDKYVVDDYTFTVSIVVTILGAMAASNWCGRDIPTMNANSSQFRYKLKKQENFNVQRKH